MRAKLLLLPLLAALACAPAAEPSTFARRSVLVIVADSLAAGHVSAYGCARATTPNFDAFAARGARFEHAYAQSSWTLPSVASLFTALEQEQHALREFDERLRADVPTLAEVFRAAGYRTVALVQSPVLGSGSGLKRGFERYRVFDFALASTAQALELAYEELARPTDAPLFVYLHCAPPHMPYQPPPPFRGRFAADGASVGALDGAVEACRRVHKAGLAPDDPAVLELAARYDEHVAFGDDALGRFLARVETLPARSRLLVVWTSDHGEAFMEHGSQGHNATVYDEMLRVPLAIAALDGALEPRVIAAPASLLDLAPTLAELCGLPPRFAGAHGVSLAPALLGGAGPPAERALAFSARYTSDHEPREFGLRRGRFKLVGTPRADAWKLFDLEADPLERCDVAAQQPALARELRDALLVRWNARASAPRGSGPPTPPADEERARRAALEALGYTQD